jgi:hypothetical protein
VGGEPAVFDEDPSQITYCEWHYDPWFHELLLQAVSAAILAVNLQTWCEWSSPYVYLPVCEWELCITVNCVLSSEQLHYSVSSTTSTCRLNFVPFTF